MAESIFTLKIKQKLCLSMRDAAWAQTRRLQQADHSARAADGDDSIAMADAQFGERVSLVPKNSWHFKKTVRYERYCCIRLLAAPSQKK
jgi:hypothetical protein